VRLIRIHPKILDLANLNWKIRLNEKCILDHGKEMEAKNTNYKFTVFFFLNDF